MKKLKGSVSAVKIRYLVFVFAIALVAALPTRVYQLIALIDANNGYFKDNDITIGVLYGALFVFSLLFILLSFLSKEVPSPKLPKGKNIFQGIFSLVMACGFAWDIFAIEKTVVPAFEDGLDSEIIKNLIMSRIEDNGGIFLILEFVFAIFSIFYFVIFGVSHLNGKASYSEYKLLALSPVCWSIANLVIRLMTAVSFVRVSELLFEIFTFVFTMLFFLTFARISSNVYTEDSMWGIYGYGFPAALFAILSSVPRVVSFAVGAPAIDGYEFNFAYLAVALFIISYIVSSLGIGYDYTRSIEKTVAEVELSDDDIVIKKEEKVSEATSDYDELLAFMESYEQEEPTEETTEEPEEIEENTEIAEEVAEVIEEVEEVTEVAEEIEEVTEVAEETEEVTEIAEEIEEVTEVAEETEEVIEVAEEIEEVTEVAEEIEEVTEVAEETEEVNEVTEEFEDDVTENAFVAPEPAVVKTIAEDKSKKAKKSLFGIRKAPVQQEEVADDLKPISLADMKKMQK